LTEDRVSEPCEMMHQLAGNEKNEEKENQHTTALDVCCACTQKVFGFPGFGAGFG